VVYACFERVLYRTSDNGVISSMKMLMKLRGQRSPFFMIDATSKFLSDVPSHAYCQSTINTSTIFRIVWKRCGPFDGYTDHHSYRIMGAAN
jgi:hypothetical protein